MSAATVPNDTPLPAPSRRVAGARLALGVLGTALTLLGFWLLFTTNSPKSLWGLLTWLVGALVLHDGVLSGLVWFANRLLKGARAKVPATVIAVVQGGVVIGFFISLLAIPPILAKAKGPQESTLPLNYGLNYAATWVLIGVLTAALAVFMLLRTRRAARPAEALAPASTPQAHLTALEAVSGEPASTARQFKARSSGALGRKRVAGLLLGAGLLGAGVLLLTRARRR